MDDGSFHAQMEILQQRRQNAAHSAFRRESTPTNDKQSRVKRLRERLHPKSIGMSPSISLTSSVSSSTELEAGKLAGLRGRAGGDGGANKQRSPSPIGISSTPTTPRATEHMGYAPPTPGRSQSLTDAAWDDSQADAPAVVMAPFEAAPQRTPPHVRAKMLAWAIQGAEEDAEAVELKKQLLAKRSFGRTGSAADMDAEGKGDSAEETTSEQPSEHGPRTPPLVSAPVTPEAGPRPGRARAGAWEASPEDALEGFGEHAPYLGSEGTGLVTPLAQEVKRRGWNSMSSPEPGVESSSKAQPYTVRYAGFSLDDDDAHAEFMPELRDTDTGGPEQGYDGGWGAAADHVRQEVESYDILLTKYGNDETAVEVQVAYENVQESQVDDEAQTPGPGRSGEGDAAGLGANQHADWQGNDASPFRAWMELAGEEGASGDFLEGQGNTEDAKMSAIEEEDDIEEPQGAELEMTASDVYYGRRGGQAFTRSHEPVSESDADTGVIPSWKTTPLAPEHWGPCSLELASESEASEAPQPAWQASAMKPKHRPGLSFASGSGNLALASETEVGLPARPFWGGLHLESGTEAEEDAAVKLRVASRPEEARNAGVMGVSLSLAESEDEGDSVLGMHRSALTKMSSLSALTPSQAGVPGFLLSDGEATKTGAVHANDASLSADAGTAGAELERKWGALEQKWADGRVQMRRAARMAAAMKAAMSTPATMSGSVSALSSDSEASSLMLGSGSAYFPGHRPSYPSGSYASSVDPTTLHTRLEALAGDSAVGGEEDADAAESESEVSFGSALGLVRQGASKGGAGWGDIPAGVETPDTMPVSSRASLAGLESLQQSRGTAGLMPSRPLDEDLEALRAAQEAWEHRAKAAEREARSLRRQSEQMQDVSRTTEASLRAELDVLRSAHERARRRQIEERGKWRRAAFQLRAALGMLLPEIQEESGDGAGTGSGDGENKTALVQRGIFTALTCLIDAGEQQDDEGSGAMATGALESNAGSLIVCGAGPALPGFPGFNPGGPLVGETRLLLGSSSTSSTAAAITVTARVLSTSDASHGDATGTRPGSAVPLASTTGSSLTGEDQSEAEDHYGSTAGGAQGAPGAVVGLPKLPVRRTPNSARSHVARAANAILKRNISEAADSEHAQELNAPVVGPAAGLGEALRELHELEQRQQLQKQQQQQGGPSAPVGPSGAAPMGVAEASPPRSPSRVHDMPQEVIWRSGRDSAKHMVVKPAAASAHNEECELLAEAEGVEGNAVPQVPSFSEFIAECAVPAKAGEPPQMHVTTDARGGAPKSAILGVVQKAGSSADPLGMQTVQRAESATPQRSAIFGVVNSSTPGAVEGAASMPNAYQPPEQRSAILGLIAQGEAERAEAGSNNLAQSGEFEFTGWGSGFTVKKTFEVLANKGTESSSSLPDNDPVSDAEIINCKENKENYGEDGQRQVAHEWTAAEPKRTAIINGGPQGALLSTKPSDVDQEKLLDTLEKWMMHQRQQAFGSATKAASKANMEAPGGALAPAMPPTKGQGSAGRGSGDEAESEPELLEDGSLESRLFQKVLARQRGLAGIKPHHALSFGDGPATPSKGHPAALDGGLEGGDGAGWMEIKASPVVQSRSPRKAPRKLPGEIEETSNSKWKPIPPLGTPVAEVSPVEMEESSSFKWRLGRGQASPKPEAQREAGAIQKEAGHPSDYYTESDNEGSFMEAKRAERHISRMPAGSGRSGRGLSRRAFGLSPGRAPVQSKDLPGRRAPARGYPSLSSYNKGNVTPPRSFPKSAEPDTPQSTVPAEPGREFADRKAPLSPLPASKSKPTIPNSPMFMGSPFREPPRETMPAASPRHGALPLPKAIPPSPISKAAHIEGADVGIGGGIGSKGGLLSKISFGLIKKKTVLH